jgi:mannose-6-phosphate isomerase-like protein (cupin superfamily)
LKKKYDITQKEIREWLMTDPSAPPSADDIGQAEDSLLHFAATHTLAPPPGLREKILGKLHALQIKPRQTLHLDHLPVLDETSNWLDWQEAVTGIEPPDEFEDIHLHPLESNEKRELFVAWVKEMVLEEVHHDLLESFLILEGSCECHITDEAGNTRTVRMGQGDFITMQIGETHDICITSPQPTVAILQWWKVAA